MDNPFERQFEPSYFPRQKKRRARRRSPSTSSDKSTRSRISPSPEPESQFVLSMGNTPVGENPPSHPPLQHRVARKGKGRRKDPDSNSTIRLAVAEGDARPPNRSTASEPFTGKITRSRPIAIELPPRSRVHAASVGGGIAATEHLSARGDIPGAFFPAQGDKQMRVYQPHPFQADVQRAREQSITLAAVESQASREAPARSLAKSGTMPNLLDLLAPDAPGRSPRQPAAPEIASTISAYNPLGDHASPIPTGKYYPTNWENRKRAKGKPIHTRPPVSAPATVQTEADVPKYHPEADAPQLRLDRVDTPKTRLQQYQREMVMHASVAASALVRGKAAAVIAKRSGTGSSSSLDLVALARIQLGKHKPVSPRLHPLGSPGPVTPMDLEDDNDNNQPQDGYLGARPVGPGSHREAGDITSALQNEEERRKRESSPLGIGQVKM